MSHALIYAGEQFSPYELTMIENSKHNDLKKIFLINIELNKIVIEMRIVV